MSATAMPRPTPRFENPCPFQFNRDQYYRLGTLGFFENCRVELLAGEIIEKYPDDPTDPSPRPFRFTREQFYRVGELGFFDGHSVELILGEIVVISPVAERHVMSVSLTAGQLKAAFTSRHYIRVQAPLNLGMIEPLPDLAVVSGTPREHFITPRTALLVVEVVDTETTRTHDTTTKAELYASAGVPDYWVLDVTNRELHVFRDPALVPAGLGATAYQTHFTHGPTDRVSPLAAPGASILVSDLLP